MAPKFAKCFKQDARMWQMTDHATEKYVATGRIACTATAIIIF